MNPATSPSLEWDPSGSSLFTPWKDPSSGITSYLLTSRVAPIQQSFYFTNTSMSTDARWLWFYTAHPPGGSADIGRTLGVVDLEKDRLNWFPETQFRDASPWVEPNTGEVYWCWGYAVYKRGPRPEDPVQLVNELPASLHRNRSGKRLATHLSLSADRKELFLDAHLGNEWLAGSLPQDGRPFQEWKRFDRCYNHAQFNPVDSDLALIAQDWWFDAEGKRHGYENRLWLLRRDGELRPLLENARTIAHEWWDADGQHVWYVDYNLGTFKIHIHTGEITSVWPNGNLHSHSSTCGWYIVGDIGTYTWDTTGCSVVFFNSETGREAMIAEQLPLPPYPRGAYHLDPHPQFCAGNRFILYTTTVRGQVDVAVVKTEDLLLATR